MLYERYHFGKKADSHGCGLDVSMTLGDYLIDKNYSSEFINFFIIPMGAAIWSTPANRVLNMPAYFFIKFFYNHGMLEIKNRPNWWVVKNGSSEYIKKIILGFEDKIYLSTPVHKVSRVEDGVEIVLSKNENTLKFECVVFATHSDQALAILEDPSSAEKDILGSITYQKNN